MQTLFEVEAETHGEVVGQELPPLRGSDKQLPWAEDVRPKLVAAINKHLREWGRFVKALAASSKTDPDRLEREQEAYRAACQKADEIFAEPYAGWWISRRKQTARELLNGVEPED